MKDKSEENIAIRWAPQPPGECELFDAVAALVRMDLDVDLLKELTGLFAEDAPQILISIRDSAAAGDATTLYRAAHTLRGQLLLFGCQREAELAAKIEQLASNGDTFAANAMYPELQIAMTLLLRAVENFRGAN